MKILVLAYICWSLTFGGIAATMALWSGPEMRRQGLDRSSLPFWNEPFRDAVVFGLIVMVVWPYLLIAMLLDKDPS
jgi:hypothetical protein